MQCSVHNTLYARHNSGLAYTGWQTSGYTDREILAHLTTTMALFYTRCLQDLPRLSINDVDRLVKKSCTTPSSKREKGFKMYIASYIDNYEGKSLRLNVIVAANVSVNVNWTIRWLTLKLAVLFDYDWQTCQLTFDCEFVWVFFYRDTVKILCKNVTLQSHIVSSSSFLTVSVKDKVTGEVSVRAVCHRSMKKSEKPHDLRVGLLLGQWLGKLINCLSA